VLSIFVWPQLDHVSFQTVAVVKPKPDRIGSVANDPLLTLAGLKFRSAASF
jgi:hypothetical protein